MDALVQLHNDGRSKPSFSQYAPRITCRSGKANRVDEEVIMHLCGTSRELALETKTESSTSGPMGRTILEKEAVTLCQTTWPWKLNVRQLRIIT